MGVTTEKITSGAFNNTRSSFYRELQVCNWTHTSIVVTEKNGQQSTLVCDSNITESQASVEVLSRGVTGMRTKATKYGMEEIPIEGERITIPFDAFRNGPYRVPEHDIIISLMEHSYAAQKMLSDGLFNPILYETTVDEEISDPRFVFQVIDPNNRWSQLYVSIFGQTIILRAGHFANNIPIGSDYNSDGNNDHKPSKLLCYLRYPYKYYNGAPQITTVFEVNLDNITNEEPIAIPGGSFVCIGETMEQLARVIARRDSGYTQSHPQIQQNSVPKVVYDSAKKQFDEEIERLKQLHKQQMETVTVEKDNVIAKLRSSIALKDAKISDLETKISYLDSMFKAQANLHETQAKQVTEEYKANKAYYEAKSSAEDNFWDFIKVASGVFAAAATVAATVYAKSKK